MVGQDETEDLWVVGKRSIRLKGFLPLWEQTRPPRLRMMEQIRGKSLDELEDLMSGFSQDPADNTVQDTDIRSDGDDEEAEGVDNDQRPGRLPSPSSIFSRFAWLLQNNRGAGNVKVKAGRPAVATSPGRLRGASCSVVAHFVEGSQSSGRRESSTSMAGSSCSEFILSTSSRA